jgi:hypothetical protein
MAGPLGPALLRMELPYGIPHTGVVLDGYEYFFGGGIQKQRPAAVVQSTGLAPIARLPLGRTARSDAEVAEHLRALAPRFSAATYDLFRNNCNHFSAALAAFLGCSVPAEIVQLPEREKKTSGCVQGEGGRRGRCVAHATLPTAHTHTPHATPTHVHAPPAPPAATMTMPPTRR